MKNEQNKPIETIEKKVVEIPSQEQIILPTPQNTMPSQQIIINQVTPPSNGVGTAGFVLALICLIFSWAPVGLSLRMKE